MQIERLKGTLVVYNSNMQPSQISQYCELNEACQALMKTAMRQLRLTARGNHRVLKLARTIADLAGEPTIKTEHLAEALQYRQNEEAYRF